MSPSTKRFGTNESPDFHRLNEVVYNSFVEIMYIMGNHFSFDPSKPLKREPDKRYLAKGEIDIFHYDSPLGSGKAYPIVFRPNDGTGNQADFQVPGVRPAWTPRIKRDFAELYVSLGTVYNDVWIPGKTNLKALTFPNKQRDGVIPYNNLSTRDIDFMLNLPRTESNPDLSKRDPQVLNDRSRLAFTLNRGGRLKFRKDCLLPQNFNGDPHAVAFAWEESILEKRIEMPESFLQIGAFISFPKDSGALRIIEYLVQQGI